MAYIIAKRIYHGEIVPLLTSRIKKATAAQKLAEIGRFPGVITVHENDAEGEIWIEVEAEDGDLISDPVCFPPVLARETLLRTGAPAFRVDEVLSDSYAERVLANLRAA